MKKIPIIILTGPTAVGKTELSINLAKKLNAEIISADSMQIYKHMDVGTAKIMPNEMDGIKHYLIDEIDPSEKFSVSDFKQRAEQYIEEINSKGKIPIITGGTGLYINSILYNMDFAKSDADEGIRNELEEELKLKGLEYMHSKLRDMDSESADRIHKNNTKRVIRAIEVCMQGKKMGDFSRELKLNEKYEPIIVILNRDREELYERINLRVDIMIDKGLEQEVKNLLNDGYKKDSQALQAIGYKEIIDMFEGKLTKKEAISIIKRNSRRYAKRQITWFKRYKTAKWFDINDYNCKEELKEAIQTYILTFFREKI